MKKCTILSAVMIMGLVLGSARAELARDYMMIVGSTTIYPFSKRVVERFVKNTGAKAPLVQATGSGGGLMLFCAGVDVLDPDIACSSRRMRTKEFTACQANGVEEIVEVKIGYDGIVLAQSVKSKPMALSLQDIYLALAKEVPDPGGGKKLVPNPYKNWKDVNKDLPDKAIEVLGPSAGSGTRSVFTKLTMAEVCAGYPWIKALRKKDMLRFRKVCRTLREDGAYIPAGEDDNQTLEHLATNPDAIALFNLGVLERNQEKIRGLTIEGVEPDFDTIADDSYPISRPLYIYIKKAHIDVVPGIREFLAELTSEKAWGNGGYLTEYGLVPMSEARRKKYKGIATNLTPLRPDFR